MRKQNKIILWSIYFDVNKSKTDGRRVPKNLAVAAPKIEELQMASKRLGLQTEIVPDAAYPNLPWLRNGQIIVVKTESKGKTIKKIAKVLSDFRR